MSANAVAVDDVAPVEELVEWAEAIGVELVLVDGRPVARGRSDHHSRPLLLADLRARRDEVIEHLGVALVQRVFPGAEVLG